MTLKQMQKLKPKDRILYKANYAHFEGFVMENNGHDVRILVTKQLHNEEGTKAANMTTWSSHEMMTLITEVQDTSEKFTAKNGRKIECRVTKA